MSYIVILNENNNIIKYTIVNELNFEKELALSTIARVNFGDLVIQKRLKPLNFSIDRNGSIKEDSGSFKRFHPQGAGVIIAEIQNSHGRTLGYRVMNNINGNIINMKTEDIVSKEAQLKRPFLQNGIVRNNTVNCYPLHKFPVIKINTRPTNKRKTEAKLEPVKSNNNKVSETVVFTEKQLHEIDICKSKGIDSRFIENPKLSPEQMRVCWVAKSKGILSEYFAKPEYSVDVMKFYADRLVNKQIANECSLMLSNPELSVSKLTELYLCICDGVDYSDIIDYSDSDIAVYRCEKSPFTISSKFDDDLSFDNALDVAMKLKGYK